MLRIEYKRYVFRDLNKCMASNHLLIQLFDTLIKFWQHKKLFRGGFDIKTAWMIIKVLWLGEEKTKQGSCLWRCHNSVGILLKYPCKSECSNDKFGFSSKEVKEQSLTCFMTDFPRAKNHHQARNHFHNTAQRKCRPDLWLCPVFLLPISPLPPLLLLLHLPPPPPVPGPPPTFFLHLGSALT